VYNKKALLFFYNAFYINELYDYLVVRPLNFLSCLISRLIEPLIFDKSLKIVSSGSFHIAKGLQLIQNGQIRSYISWLIAGAGAITLYLVLGGL
jgi:NADH-quinone oxidoreductase subunit L